MVATVYSNWLGHAVVLQVVAAEYACRCAARSLANPTTPYSSV